MKIQIFLKRIIHVFPALILSFSFFVSVFLYADSLVDKIIVAPFMKVVEVSGGAEMIKGLRTKILAFQTSKTDDDIVKYYNKIWDGQLKTVEGAKWIYHSNYDGKYLTVVQVRKIGKNVPYNFHPHFISGLISISEPNTKEDRDKITRLEYFYPLVPGVITLSDLTAVDMGKKNRTTVLDLPGGVSHNLYYYLEYFKRKGWQESHLGMAAEMERKFKGTSLIMSRGLDELVLSFIPDKQGRTKMVGVYIENLGKK